MRIIDDTFIIGIDSGYGNIKTANCCFPASVAVYDTEPVFKDNTDGNGREIPGRRRGTQQT